MDRKKQNVCFLCKQKTLFFIWSSSKNINIKQIMKLDRFKELVRETQRNKQTSNWTSQETIWRRGQVVCGACIKKYKLLGE